MSGKTQQDIEFEKKLAKATYKTTYHEIGAGDTKVSTQKGFGINGKFTDHLIYSGMPRNASLNTTAQKYRWVNGSRDWMEKLG